MIYKNRLVQSFDDGQDRPLLGLINFPHLKQTGYSSTTDCGPITSVDNLSPTQGEYNYEWDYPEWRKLKLLREYTLHMFLDIEVLIPPDVSIDLALQTFNYPITALMVYDLTSDKWCQWSDEADILRMFERMATDQDNVLFAWNAAFDIGYLKGRYGRVFGTYGGEHGLEFIPAHINVVCPCVDYISLYKKYVKQSERSFSLDYILKKHLGKGKLEFSGSLFELYRDDREKYLEYNREDVLRWVELEKKLKIVPLCRAILDLTSSVWQDILYNTVLIENMIYQHLKGKRLTFRNRPLQSDEVVEEKSYEGAYVYEPLAGIYRNESTCYDFTGLYPHIIVNWNVSPETRGTDLMCCSGRGYTNHVHGVIPDLVRRLIRTRLELKKSGDRIGEQAHKMLANSVYGAFGAEYFRFADKTIAEDIALQGQHINLTIMNLIENGEIDHDWYRLPLDVLKGRVNHRKVVLAGDTDSLFVRGGVDLADWINNHARHYMDAWRCIGGDEFALRVKNEYGCIRALWLRPIKKNYWVLTADDKIITKGGVSVKSDSPSAASEIIDTLVTGVLHGLPFDAAHGAIAQLKECFFSEPWDLGWWKPFKIQWGKQYKVQTRAAKACKTSGIREERGWILEFLVPPENGSRRKKWSEIPVAVPKDSTEENVKTLIEKLLEKGWKLNYEMVFDNIFGMIEKILEEVSK